MAVWALTFPFTLRSEVFNTTLKVWASLDWIKGENSGVRNNAQTLWKAEWLAFLRVCTGDWENVRFYLLCVLVFIDVLAFIHVLVFLCSGSTGARIWFVFPRKCQFVTYSTWCSECSHREGVGLSCVAEYGGRMPLIYKTKTALLLCLFSKHFVWKVACPFPIF